MASKNSTSTINAESVENLAMATPGTVLAAHEEPALNSYENDIQQLRTDNEMYRALLEHATHHDPLTGLPNRKLFNTKLDKALLTAKRTNSQVAVLLLDLDHFKKVNDSLGHHVGDSLLKEVAQRLRKTVRQTDTVARHAGDEFTLILEQINSQSDVSNIANRIRTELEKPYNKDSYELVTAASIGVSMYPLDSSNIDEMIRFADTAMHQAKKTREHNSVQFFDSAFNVARHERIALERDLHIALQESQFELNYQPQLDLNNNSIVGYEALVRWHHPEKGTISPDLFIPLAEETGFIGPLGEWILTQACKALSQLRATGRENTRISVNVSAKQFSKGDLGEKITAILKEAGVKANSLELELTESALLDNPEHTIETLTALREIGVEISIDDFGTGYSSFSRLRELPLSRIKIDKSFVQGIPANQGDIAIAKAIISVAHELGMEVVAEGIETQCQAEYLNNMNCDILQGYYIGRPAPFSTVVDAKHSVEIQSNEDAAEIA